MDIGTTADLFVGDVLRALPRSPAIPVCLHTIAEAYCGYRVFSRAFIPPTCADRFWEGTWGQRYGVRVCDRLSEPLARWVMARVFAAKLLRDTDHPADEIGELQAAVAASLLIPRSRVRSLSKVAHVAESAKVLSVPRAAVLMRLSEVSGAPGALVIAHRTGEPRRRGSAPNLLPKDEAALRAFAASKLPHRGVLKVRCDEEPARPIVLQEIA